MLINDFSSRFLLGNPGDYVWGRDGLDSIVSQLLNQIDGAGPPPLTKEKIQEIPSALISQDHLGKIYCKTILIHLNLYISFELFKWTCYKCIVN